MCRTYLKAFSCRNIAQGIPLGYIHLLSLQILTNVATEILFLKVNLLGTSH